MAGKGEVRYKLIADGKEFADVLDQAGAKLAEMTAAFLGLNEVTTQVSESLAAFGEKQDDINKLTIALANQGQLVGDTAQELREYAAALEQVTIFDDHAVMGAQAYFANLGMTKEQIKQTTAATVELASATGMDLQSAAMQVGRAIETGTSKTLKQYGIVLDETASSTERLHSVNTQLMDHFQGSATAAAQTYTGQMKQLKNAEEEAQASFGFFLTQLVSPPSGGATQWMRSLEKYFRTDMPEALSEFRAKLLEWPADMLEAFGKFEKGIAGSPFWSKFLKGATFGAIDFTTNAGKASAGNFEFGMASALRNQAKEQRTADQKIIDAGIQGTAHPTNNPDGPRGLGDANGAKGIAKANAEFWKEDAEAAKLYTEELGKVSVAQAALTDPLDKEIAEHRAAYDALHAKIAALKEHEEEAAKSGTITAEQLATGLATLDADDRLAAKVRDLSDEHSRLTLSIAQTDAGEKELNGAYNTYLDTLGRLHPSQEITTTKLQLEYDARMDQIDAMERQHKVTAGAADDLRTLADATAALAEEERQRLVVVQALSDAGSIAGAVGKAVGGGGGKVLGAGGGLFGAASGFMKGGGINLGDIFHGGGEDENGDWVGDSTGQMAMKLVGGIARALPMASAALGFVKSIAGLFGKSEAEKIGEDLGGGISDGLAKKIADTESKDKVSRSLAEMLNADDIYKETGNTDKIFDLMNARKLGLVDEKEAVDQLNKSYTDLQAAAAGGDVASEAAMIDMIARARELGMAIPELDKQTKALVEDAANQLGAFFAGQGSEIKNGKLTGAAFGGDATLAANEKIFDGIYQALIGSDGLIEATKDVKGSVDDLQRMANGAPLTGGAAEAAHYEELLKNPLYAGVASASKAGGQAMHSLLDSDNLSQGVVDAFGTAALGLKEQAIAGGGSEKDAEAAMEPLLAQMQHAEVMGLKLSPESQAMLEQAQKDGMLPAKTVAEQHLEIARQTRDGVYKLAGLNTTNTSDNTNGKNTTNNNTNTVPPTGNPPAGGGSGNYPGPANYSGVPHYAVGGKVRGTPGGSLAVMGDGGEDEYAVPESKAGDFARSILGAGRGGTSVTINMPVTVNGANRDPKTIADEVIHALRGNVNGIVTQISRSLAGRG